MSETPEQTRTKCGKLVHRTRAREGAKPQSRSRTPVQLARQKRVFDLSVFERKTYRQIAAALLISLETVVLDIRCESKRRYDAAVAAQPKGSRFPPAAWWREP